MSTAVESKKKTNRPKYEPQNFDHLLGTPGFSDKLLKNHFKLYEGYVKNVNALADIFAAVKDPEAFKKPQFAELKRRFGWEFNGMRLHEYYFGNMGKGARSSLNGGFLLRRLSEEFGSFQNWQNEFMGMGAMRGIGWVILAYDRPAERFFNIWVNEHDLGFLAGAEPLLVMDVFEHAFMTDYGLEKDKYISAFWKAIQWAEVESRFTSRRTYD